MKVVAKLGTSPKDTEDVTIRKGVLYIGKYPALNFETGDVIPVKRTITYQDVYKILYSNGAVAKKMKVYKP